MVTRKRIYDPVLTKYSVNWALICLQTVQLHSTALTLTLDILKLKDGVDTSSYCAMKNIYSNLGFLCLAAWVM